MTAHALASRVARGRAAARGQHARACMRGEQLRPLAATRGVAGRWCVYLGQRVTLLAAKGSEIRREGESQSTGRERVSAGQKTGEQTAGRETRHTAHADMPAVCRAVSSGRGGAMSSAWLAALLCAPGLVHGVPLGHSRKLLFYDPSGLHLAIIGMVRCLSASRPCTLLSAASARLLAALCSELLRSGLQFQLTLCGVVRACACMGAQAFVSLVLFCFLFRGTFMPMKYKKLVEDRDPFFVDHWTNLCKHNKLGTDCPICRRADQRAPASAPYQQAPPMPPKSAPSAPRSNSERHFM